MMMKTDNFEYLSKVFKGLSVERKDNVLNTARALLKIQDGNAGITSVNNAVLTDEGKKPPFLSDIISVC